MFANKHTHKKTLQTNVIKITLNVCFFLHLTVNNWVHIKIKNTTIDSFEFNADVKKPVIVDWCRS